MSQPTDPQADAVYAAEAAAQRHFAPRQFESFAEVDAFVQQVVCSEYWDARFPNAPMQTSVQRRSRNATYSAGGRQADVGVLWLIDGYHWNSLAVLHELSHIAVGGDDPYDHGAKFRTAELDLVREFVGVQMFGELAVAFTAALGS